MAYFFASDCVRKLYVAHFHVIAANFIVRFINNYTRVFKVSHLAVIVWLTILEGSIILQPGT